MNLEASTSAARQGPFDHCAVASSATAHSANRLFTREKNQVIARDRLGSRPRMLGDRGCQLPGILWGLPALR
jgi:hypothetical protein